MGRKRKTVAEVSASRRIAALARWSNGTRGAEYQRLRDIGMTVSEVAQACGVGDSAVRMALRLRAKRQAAQQAAQLTSRPPQRTSPQPTTQK